MLNKSPYLIYLPFFLLFVFACEETSLNNESKYPLAVEQGIDVPKIALAFDQLETIYAIRGIALGKGGEIAAEKYYNRTDGQDLHDVRSVTKSVMGLLTGIAIEEGYIQDLQMTLGEIMTKNFIENPDTAVEAITIEDLLRMSSGLEWHEFDGGNSYMEWYNSNNHIDWVLDQEFIHEPGDGFNYNTGSIHLLSYILSLTTGKSALEFAQEQLFDPMDIKSDWSTLPPVGHVNNGGAGLQISVESMFKLGNLMLADGMWEGEQLIPSDWVEQSTTFQNFTHGNHPNYAGYGYLWWLGEEDGLGFFYASGFGGQFILCVPELDFVVVTAANWNGLSWDEAGDHWNTILLVLMQTVLPAVV